MSAPAFLRRAFRTNREQSGFTLVEMLITIVLVALITGATVMSFSLAVKASSTANQRVKKSNDAEFITRFLVPDAASAGGFNQTNLADSAGANGFRPGVHIQPTTGPCQQSGARVRFDWVERVADAPGRQISVTYTLSGTNLTRTLCIDLDPPSTAIIARNVVSVTPVCIPACSGPGFVDPPPVIVSFTVTETTDGPTSPTPYTFTVSGFVRAGGNSGTPTAATVPLIALGVPSGGPCPSSQGAPVASGVAVAARKTTAPADPFPPKITVFGVAAINSSATSAALCGQAGDIASPDNGAEDGWFATETLVLEGGTCSNCGTTIPLSAPIEDPYAGMTPPPNAANCGGSGNPSVTSSGQQRIYQPGVYNDTLTINISGNHAIFQSGVYIFCNGMRIQSGILAQSQPGGVLFYFAHGSLRRIIPTSGGNDDYSDINWQIDGRPEYRNVVIWQPNPTTANVASSCSGSSCTGDLEIAVGENDPISTPLSSRFGGVIYAPQAQVEFYLPVRETLTQYQTVEASAFGVVARNVVADRISRIRLGEGPQTVTSITANPNPSVVGQPLTLTATVAPVYPATGTPTGAVTFFDDATQLGTADLVSGVATLNITSLAGGARPLKAIYSGDLTFASSVSPTLNTVLTPAPSITTLVSNPNPSGEGSPVLITATVTHAGAGPVATGTVTFYDGATAIGTAGLNGAGVASISVNNLLEGIHDLVAVYGGNGSYLGSTSNHHSHAVMQPSNVVVISDINPSYAGDAVQFTATVAPVSGGPVPVGTVTFYDGATQIGGGAVVLNGAGVATVTVNNLASGPRTITAEYSGDPFYAPSNSAPYLQIVNAVPVTVTLASSANPSSVGAQLTLTATIVSSLPGRPTPGGTVTFFDGLGSLGAGVAAGAGVWTLATDLTLGSHSLTAVYSGDTVFIGGTSNTVTQQVNAGTGVTIIASAEPSFLGDVVTYYANVSENPANTPGAPAGNVEFRINGTLVSTAPLIGTTATYVTPSAPAIGSYAVTGTFVPTGGNFSGSVSPTYTHVVSYPTTSIAVTSSANPSGFGQQVTFTATVTAAVGGPPTGTAFFYDNLSPLNPVASTPLVNGVASVASASLTPGSHSIAVFYVATGQFSNSNTLATPLTQIVREATTVVLAQTAGANPSTSGSSVSFTATVNDLTTSAPTGTVSFFDIGSAVPVATVPLVGTTAVWTTTTLAGGAHSITAVYNGDTTFAPSPPSNAVAQVVESPTTIAVTSNLNPSLAGQSVTITATVTSSGGTPTGTVYFYDNLTPFAPTSSVAVDGTGAAVVSTSFATGGSHSIVVYFVASGAFASSNTSATPLNQFVYEPTTVALAQSAGSNPSNVGQSVSFTATVADGIAAVPTGTVSFFDNGGAVPVATISLAGTSAVWTTSALAGGSHSITAVYNGNATFALSPTSAAVVLAVRVPTTVAVTGSPNPSGIGQLVTFTATVTAPTGTPTGTVFFYDNLAPMAGAASASVVGGVATVTTSSLGLGSHSIVVFYVASGAFVDSNNLATPFTQTVREAATVNLARTAGASTSAAGLSLSFTATVTDLVAAVPTGSVSFYDNGGVVPVATVSLTGTTAVWTTTTLAVGTHSYHRGVQR